MKALRGVGPFAFALLGASMALPTLVGLLAVDLTADLGFGDRGLGVAVSAFWLVTAVAAPLCGRWVDRRGWLLGSMLGAFSSGGCLVVCVLFVDSVAGLVIVLALSGLAYSLCSPTSNLIVMAVVPRRRQASVLGLKQTAPPLLTALAGATLPAVAHVYGWRAAMAAGLVLPLVVLVGAPTLRTMGAPSRYQESLSRSGSDADRSSPVESELRRTRAAPIVVAAGLGTLSVATVTGFAVLTLVDAGMAPISAAAVVSVGSLLAVAARVVLGACLDRRSSEDTTLLLALMAIAAAALTVVAAGILGARAVDSPAWAVVVVAGVLAALVTAWTWPALLLLSVVRRAAGPGAASGLLQLGSGVGSAVGPLLFGVLSAAGGRGWAWLLMGGCTVLAMLLVRRAAAPRPVRPPDEEESASVKHSFRERVPAKGDRPS